MHFLMFERRVLKKIFELCNDESTNEWRIRQNKKLQEPYQSPSITMTLPKEGLSGQVMPDVKNDHC